MDDRVVFKPEVLALTGLSRNTILRLEQDGEFPRSRPIGKRKKGWFESEIQAWIEGKKRLAMVRGDTQPSRS